MASSWLAGAVATYCGVMERGQRRWLEAQEDACLSWWSAVSPWGPLSDGEMQRRIDGSLLAGASLVQAQADTQRDLMLLTEKLLTEVNRNLQQQLQDSGESPSLDAMRQALQLGCVSGGAMSKLSRQVGHFAATNLSSAPLKAARDVRRAWEKA
ncbi:hypothetical protein CEK28_04105 [Xenophilus sp. AP218F]|nr:hypothetical protein [Chromobacterium sp. ASV5]OWY39933.1 hypothetical protein CEK28_04105 [Xenophilus sp. AP218F]